MIKSAEVFYDSNIPPLHYDKNSQVSKTHFAEVYLNNRKGQGVIII